VALDTSLAPCDIVVMTATISGATDPSTAYYVQYRVDGGAWQPLASYYGYPGVQTITYNIAYDGYYELRSGSLVVLSTCPASTGFNVYKNYCDAYTTSTSTTPASNNCSNGKFTLNMVDPQRCSYQTYVGYIFSGGDTVANLIVTNISGDNVTAGANLPAGNYSYSFYTIGTYLTGLAQPKCPISGSFTIPNAGCNITFTNEVINNGCNGTDYSAQINGITCEGQFLVQLYKDGNLIESNNVYEYSTVGNIGYGFLSPGNYTVKVFANHLNPGTCFAESNFTANAMSCDLSITNLVVTNAAADLSTFGSVNFNVAGTECSGYQVTLKKNGVVYFGNNVTPTGPLTPISFSSLPPDNYEIIFSNGFCEVSQLFTITQGNLSCNINYTNLTTSNVTTNGGSNGTINFTLNGNTCGSGQYEIEVYRNSVLLQSANYTATGSSTSIGLSNLPAGNIQVLVYNGCMSGINECAITFASLLTEPPVCNLLVSVTNETIPGPGCSNGILTVNMQGNANGNDYVLNVTQNGNYVFSAGYPSGSAVTDVISNLSAGVYDLNLSYTGSGSCGSNASYTLTNTPCNLSIDNVVTTQTADNAHSGSIAFDVNGTICETSSLQLLSATGTVLVNSTISESEGRLFENLDVGNYSIQVITPGGCSVNYPFVIDAFCDINVFNETISLEGAGSCTTGKLSYYVTASNFFNLIVKLINSDDLSVFYQSNVPNWDGIDANEINNIPAGNYTLQVINASGNCSDSYNFTIAPAPCSNIQFSNITLGVSTIGCTWAFGYDLNLGNCPGSVLTLSKDGNLLNTYNINSTTSTEIGYLTIGNYNLHLNTSSGCNIDYPFVVNPTCNLAVNNAVVTQTVDNANNGSIAFNLSGDICNDTPLQLLSSTGAVLTTQLIYEGGNYNFDGLSAGNYSVQVTNAGGCSVNYPFVIDAFCDINVFNETISLEGAGSCTTAKLSYYVTATNFSALIVKLINTDDLSVFYQSNVPNWDGIDANEINNIPAGNYTLQVINASGNCSDSYNFTIAPAPCSNIQFSNITLGVSTIGCTWAFGYDLNLGNCPGSVLTLSKDGNLLNTYNINSTTSTEIGYLTIGNYNLHLNTSSGCNIDYPFVVNPTCNLAVNNAVVTQTVDNANNGSIAFNLSGDICNDTPLQLLSSTGAVLTTQLIYEGGNYNFDGLSAANYSVQVANAVGCSVNYPFVIDAFCDINIFNETISLEGAGSCTTAKLSYYVTATNFSALIVKLINSDDLSVFYQSNVPNWDGIDANEINNIPAGNYTLQVINASGNCSDSYNFSIAPAPCSNIQFSNITLGVSTIGCTWAFGYDLNLGNCPGSVLTLSKDGNLLNTYNINSTTSTEIGYLTIGNYNLHLNTSSGCNIDYPFVVNPTCNLAVNNAVVTQTVDNANNGSIAFNLSGDICNDTPLQLLSSTGAVLTTQLIYEGGNYNFDGLSAANYSVQVANAVGCSVNYPFVIDAFCDINIFNETISLEGAGSCTTAKLSYYVTATNFSALIVKLINSDDLSVFYQSNVPNWDGIDANEINNIPAGNYTLQVINASGNCNDSYNFTIAPAPCSNIQFSNVTINPSQIDGCYSAFGYDLNLGNCPGSVLTLNQNGSIIETYNLIGSVSTEITDLTAGNYNLHLSSAGCEIDYPFVVTPNACNITYQIQ
jgi:hypothetical protein